MNLGRLGCARQPQGSGNAERQIAEINGGETHEKFSLVPPDLKFLHHKRRKQYVS